MSKGDSGSTTNLCREYFNAALNNEIGKIRTLIKENKVEVDARDPDDENRTALHIAAKKGHTDLIRTLVEEFKANMNIEDMFGEVALHIAADNGHMDIVRFLVAKGSRYSEDVQHLLGTPTCEAPMVVKAQ